MTPEETIKHRKIYKRLYFVDKIIRLLSVKTNKPIFYLYKNIIWDLYHMNDDPLLTFQSISLGNVEILNKLNIAQKIKNELIKIIKIRFPPKLIEIRCVFKLICYSFDGIDVIKESLINGKKAAEKKNIHIIYNYLGAPEYECIIYTYNKNEGIILMDESLNEIKNSILNKNGSFLLEKQPLIVYPKKKDFLF